MRLLPLLFASILFSGCVGNPPRSTDMATYDFGNLAGTWTAPLPIAAVDVRAPSWLDSSAQLYRLGYADDLRRRSYAASRWAAPPAELLERALQRRIVYGQPDFAGRGCRLALTLDELEQRFDSEQSSQLVMEVRARLLPPGGDTLLSKRAFLIRKAAPSADARGSVAAAREAVQALSMGLDEWLVEAKSNARIAAACQGA